MNSIKDLIDDTAVHERKIEMRTYPMKDDRLIVEGWLNDRIECTLLPNSEGKQEAFDKSCQFCNDIKRRGALCVSYDKGKSALQ